MRKFTTEGEMFLRSTRLPRPSGGVGPTPSGMARKRNPDRARSSDCRLISEIRRINLCLRKDEMYRILSPTVYGRDEEILRSKSQIRARRFILANGKSPGVSRIVTPPRIGKTHQNRAIGRRHSTARRYYDGTSVVGLAVRRFSV